MIKKTTGKAGFKKSGEKAAAPVAQHERAIKHLEDGGTQHSKHPAKSQSRIMRHLKR